MKDNAPINQ